MTRGGLHAVEIEVVEPVTELSNPALHLDPADRGSPHDADLAN
jgi:hypothetical protein